MTKRWKVQRRDWVLHPPFNSWQRGVVDMITYMVEEGNEPAKAVWEAL